MPSTARTLLIPWIELPKRWEELVELLGKESVYRGSLERYSAGRASRRGTSLVDDEFLNQMEQWREHLASNIALRNRDLTVAELNESVQQTIDRLVFLRIAEDRGIETYEMLKDAAVGPGVYARLLAIFRSADVRYNSGLFHFREEAAVSGSPDLLTPRLQIDDRVLRSIIVAMYYPESPYEFSVLPADILGQVYEQFLGKVIRLTPAHTARIEDKPEVRRAGGVYYTPTWVVNHIVERTLGQALEGKSPSAALRIRILDPACGSGSFLIGAYDHLLNWFSNAYSSDDTKGRDKRMYQDGDGTWRLTLLERKRILTSCIYGVDIDPQAVEVTKLSLMLKVLEGQSTETINRQMQMFHVDRVLPDLNRNIQCGNSLVGTDVASHLLLDRSDEHALNPVDWDVMFPAIMDKGGFDVVIGNPPYDVLEKDRGDASWPHSILRSYLPFRADYEPALGGKLNLYRIFLVRTIGLTRPNGYFGMIVPLSLAADISTAATRRFVLTSLSDVVLDCFPQKDNVSRRVFTRAKLSTMIVTGVRSRTPVSTSSQISTHVYPGNSLSDPAAENTLTADDAALLDPSSLPIPLTDAVEWRLCRRIHTLPGVVPLVELNDSYLVTRGEINQTVFRKYIHATQDGYVQMLKGSEVRTFAAHVAPSQGHQEWIDEAGLLRDNPAKPKPGEPRIATQRITGVDERQRLAAAVVTSGAWFADSTNSIAAVRGAALDLDFLVGLLNSDLFQWRFRISSTNNNVATNELLRLPIRVPGVSTVSGRASYDAIRTMAARLAEIKSSWVPSRSASEIDRHQRRVAAEIARLNDAVYDLYELNVEDRLLVESRLPQRPASEDESED